MDNEGHDGDLFGIASAVASIHNKTIVSYDQVQTISQKARGTFQKRLCPDLETLRIFPLRCRSSRLFAEAKFGWKICEL